MPRTPTIDRRRRWLYHKIGLSTIEYAVLIAVIVAALLGISIYFKRSLSGKWRSVGDTFGYGRQYAP